jgi:hypothetical protein
MAAVKLRATFKINSLIWITSLDKSEIGATDRVMDAVLPVLQRVGFPLTSFHPRSAKELLDILDEVADQAKTFGLRPMIHIDTHGSRQNGLYVSASGEYVSWDNLSKKFRAINTITGNDLCVVSAACFCFDMIYSADIQQAVPFFMFIAPEKEVTFGFVETTTVKFYEEIFTGGDIIEAYKKYLAPNLTLFNSEKMLGLSLAKYIRNHCVGKPGKKRQDRLFTTVMSKKGAINSPETRKKVRKQIKDMMRPSQNLIDKYVRQFMIGKKVSFTLEALMDLVEADLHRDQKMKPP